MARQPGDFKTGTPWKTRTTGGERVDLDAYLSDRVYPALFDRLDLAFTEFNFKKAGKAWEATSWPADFPMAVCHQRPDRLMVYRDRPWWIKVHGHDGVRFLDLVNGGRRPRGDEYLPAVKALCERAGVPYPVPERQLTQEELAEQRRADDRRAVLEDLMVLAQQFLWGAGGRQALAYLREGRGLTDEDIREQGLGFFPPAADVRKHLLDRGHAEETCKEAGVLGRKLEGFVLIPWMDERGRPLTVYGRYYQQRPPLMKDHPGWRWKRDQLRQEWEGRPDPKGQWAEPEVPKTYALRGKDTKASPFCFDLARRAGHCEMVLVEGVFDALLLQRRGETRAVASVAASLSGEQVKTLRRCGVERVFVCGDPDGGGERGTLSNVRALLGAGITPFVVPDLPAGLDPDDFVRGQGIDSWRTRVEQSTHGLCWCARRLVAAHTGRVSEASGVGKGGDVAKDRLVTEALAFARDLPGGCGDDLRRYYLPVIAAATGASEDSLHDKLRNARERSPQGNGQAGGSGDTRLSARPKGPAPTLLRAVPSYRPFPLEHLPDPLRRFSREGAASMGCDLAYFALPGITVMGSAIGTTRTIALKRGWHEPSIFWGTIVGDSGTLKSPAFSRVMEPVYATQRRLIEEHKRAAAAYPDNLDRWKEAKKKAEKGEGEDPGPKPEPPVLRRVVLSDTTIEKLAEVLEDNPRGVLVGRDELAAWFNSFARYKGKAGGSDMPNWLEMHRAGTLIVDRKTGERRTLFVRRAGVSLVGSIQPGILARALTEDAFDAGLGARLLLTMPPKKPKVWTDLELDPDTEAAFLRVYEHLRLLDFASSNDGPVPRALPLTPDAKMLWVAFYNAFGQEQVAVEGDLAAAFSKLEGYAARFALLHHLVRAASAVDERGYFEPVAADSVGAGIALARWFVDETRRIYTVLHESADERALRELVQFIRGREGRRVTTRKLQNSNSRKYPTAAHAEAALDRLVQAGLGRWVDGDAREHGGHRERFLELSPTADSSDTWSDAGSGREPGEEVD
jgi:hypothetical protein